VVITLTDAGAEVLRRALPVHFGGVSAHFLGRLTDEELAALQAALEKVVIDCDFG
jgi:DNA-binding MarR family transcriptional regulator